ncbi:MAG: hypothetical protein J5593_00945 [Bacteroidaceae bacterium]|nr:hypothetical protein [Bacteroidaceae bacterium]
MRHATRYILLIVTALCLLASCSYQSTEHNNKWTLTQSQRDSIAFSTYHHYNVGYNFLCTADSMLLSPHPEGMALNLDYPHENVCLYEDDDFVITEVFHNKNIDNTTLDSIWLCVGSDGIPLGWISEQELLHNATPVDPISQFMAFGYRNRGLIEFIVESQFLIIITFVTFSKRGIPLLSKDKETSIYPFLFWIAILSAASVLGTIKCLTPEMWHDFYYHPSLNPVGQPPMLALYLSLIWLSIILFIAIFFDLKDKVSAGKTLLTLAAAAVVGVWFYLGLSEHIDNIYAICGLYVFLVALFLWLYFKSKKTCKSESQ